MPDLLKRKTKLTFDTPLTERKRTISVEIKPWGLEMWPKRKHYRLSLTWAQLWHTANLVEGDRIAAERKKKKKTPLS